MRGAPDKGELVMFLTTRMPPGAPRTKPTDVLGEHQPGFTHLVLSSEERRVITMHRNLERYLDLPAAPRWTAPDA
ncbi:hypothetical protein MAHJHV33_48710 [Mycobacterium avium subsp. hominissuis]